MGRFDFRPARVRQTISVLLSAKRSLPQPAWYEAMGDVPPPEILTRTLPVRHRVLPQTGRRRIRKASKLFAPQQITYEEDALRTEFFKDHPWELARPRLIIEDDGKDYQHWDWSKAFQPGRPIGGESVVQRQRYLMHKNFDELEATALQALGNDATQAQIQRARDQAREQARDKAYDQARKELYRQRHDEEVEARVAVEEALAVGASFGKTVQDVGMELEKRTFDSWKKWANEQATLLEQQRAAAYAGPGQGATTLVDDVLAPPKKEGDQPVS